MDLPPTLVMHGEDGQIGPFVTTGKLSTEIVPGAELESYSGNPHGVPTTHADQINAYVLAFIQD